MLCGQEAYLATVISTVQFFGVLVGTVVFGHLGDTFGRKKVSLVGIAILIVSGAASGERTVFACIFCFKDLLPILYTLEAACFIEKVR